MKGLNAARIGVLTIIAVGILIWGYSFLKGQTPFGQSTIVYVEYENSGWLNVSAPVRVNGVKVGNVKDMYLKEDYSGNIMVVLSLTEQLKISKSKAIAAIETTSFMGTTQISLLFPKGGCNGDDCLQSGDTISNGTVSMIAAMLPESKALKPKVEQVIGTVNSTIQKLSTSWERQKAANTINSNGEVKAIMANLNAATKNMKGLIGGINDKMNTIQSNVKVVTTGLTGQGSDIQKTMANATAFTKQLKTTNLKKTQGNAGAVANDLKKTMKTLNETLEELEITMTTLNSGKGTVGKLMKDNQLYNRIDTASLNFLKKTLGGGKDTTKNKQ